MRCSPAIARNSLLIHANAFSQTPTFNATPVVEAALEACRRGILVEIYADLGFNDAVSSQLALLVKLTGV